MAREIKPTPVLEGQDVIEFYKKLAGFRRSLAEKELHVRAFARMLCY